MTTPVTVSVVSHGHGSLATAIMQDLERHCRTPLDLILTLNIPEEPALPPSRAGFAVRVIRNDAPKGFGANHNAAFRKRREDFFCVLNPDVRVDADPFPPLLRALEDRKVALAAPRIVDGNGRAEASARSFPTPMRILAKAFGMGHDLAYPTDAGPVNVDWVAGMFMLFRSDAFARVGGFDERYFLYYEDVDICRRLRAAGYDVIYEPRSAATHLAQRTSHRDLRYMRWHLKSMLRFFLTR